MTGLDKMVGRILEEAKSTADLKIQEARKEAEKILTDSAAQTEELCSAAERQSEADVRNYMDRAGSSADLRKRKAILKAKQEIISEILAKAYETVVSLDDDAYFQTIEKMLQKFALPMAGELCFSARDLARLPAGFAAKAEKIADRKSVV